jgi:hypothetical protein
MAQGVEHLASNHEALSSNSSTTKNEEEEEEVVSRDMNK